MTVRVLNPATEETLAELSSAGIENLDIAVSQAYSAQKVWAKTAPERKAGILLAISHAIHKEREALSILESQNVGMPIADARNAVQGAAEVFRYYSGAPERLLGSTIPVEGGINTTFHEPLGVVGLITPWNFPLSIASWKIAPALAAGNALVLKPAELTPLTALRLEQIVVEAGLPEGLLNVVVGKGSVVGKRLVEHPKVRKIAFTGSTRVGRSIAQIAAQDITRVTLELGGKSPALIFQDADLEAAAAGLVGGAFGNAGQDCCARSRVFIHRSVADDFLDILREVVKGIRLGDPLDPTTNMGPLISASQRDVVNAFVKDAPVAFSGTSPEGPGFWFPPTVLYPTSDDHPAATQEIFGPVVSILPFDDEDEVVERANSTEYGLSGSIWTENIGRAIRVARAVESGTLSVNSYNSVRITTPFGGFKQSGIGRELGPDAPLAYTELKNVFFHA